MKTHKSNIIFFSDLINLRAGGPAGYIANLEEGLNNLNNAISAPPPIEPLNNDVKIITKNYIKEYNLKFKFIAKILSLFVIPKAKRKKLRTKILYSLNLGKDFTEFDIKYIPFIKELDKYTFDTITCHYFKDTLFIKKYLKSRNINAKLITMSHSPEPPSREAYHMEKVAKNINAAQNYELNKALEKEAFYSADIMLFPSEEATEPYQKYLPYFDDWKNKIEFKYLATGCKQLHTDKSTEELRSFYNIETPYILTYIGRHTTIKGYDILKEIATNILNKRDDVTFLIGGVQSNEFEPLNHPRWKELGRINPAEVLKITDAFILPNRETYFDLILLEILSTGTYCFASNTGGNKSVYKQTNEAITLCENTNDFCNKINEFLNKDNEYKKSLSDKSLEAYLQNYTPEIFAQNYIKLLNSIK